MNKDAVQNERGPRNSTLRKQMAMFMNKETELRNQESLYNISPSNITPSIGIDMNMRIDGLTRLSTALFQTSTLRHSDAFNHSPPPTIAQQPSLTHLMTTQPSLLNTMGVTTHPLLCVEQMREQAAQLLFMNVNFLKNLSPFTQLPQPDQLVLFEESWCEFFILGIAENLLPVNFSQLLFAYEFLNPTFQSSDSKLSSDVIFREVETFQNILNKFIQMRIDTNEYVYLRAIVLYKSDICGKMNRSNETSDMKDDIVDIDDDNDQNDHKKNTIKDNFQSDESNLSGSTSSKSYNRLIDPLKIQALQINAKEALAAYEQNYYGIAHQIRYRSLLSLLPSLKVVNPNLIEELFFRRNIGNIPLFKLLVDLYRQKN